MDSDNTGIVYNVICKIELPSNDENRNETYNTASSSSITKSSISTSKDTKNRKISKKKSKKQREMMDIEGEKDKKQDALNILETYTLTTRSSMKKRNITNNNQSKPSLITTVTKDLSDNSKRKTHRSSISRKKKNSSVLNSNSNNNNNGAGVPNIETRRKRWEKQLQEHPIPKQLGTKKAKELLKNNKVSEQTVFRDETQKRAEKLDAVIEIIKENKLSIDNNNNNKNEREKNKFIASSSPIFITKNKSFQRNDTNNNNVGTKKRKISSISKNRHNSKQIANKMVPLSKKIVGNTNESVRFVDDVSYRSGRFKLRINNGNNKNGERNEQPGRQLLQEEEEIMTIDRQSESSNIRIMNPSELSDREDLVLKAHEFSLQEIALRKLNSLPIGKKTSLDDFTSSSSPTLNSTTATATTIDNNNNNNGDGTNLLSPTSITMDQVVNTMGQEYKTNVFIDSLAQRWNELNQEIENDMGIVNNPHVNSTRPDLHDSTMDNDEDEIPSIPMVPPVIREYIRKYRREPIAEIHERPCMFGRECESVKKCEIAINQRNISTQIWNTSTADRSNQYVDNNNNNSSGNGIERTHRREKQQQYCQTPFPLREFLLPSVEDEIMDGITDGYSMETIMNKIKKRPCILCNLLSTTRICAAIACGIMKHYNRIIQDHSNEFDIEGQYRSVTTKFVAGERFHGLIAPIVRYDRNNYTPTVFEVKYNVLDDNNELVERKKIVRGWEEIDSMVYHQQTSHSCMY